MAEGSPEASVEFSFETPSRLPFPPLTRQHVLNCSVHSWHPKYRTITPKTRLVPLTSAFTDYLRADGIILPPDEEATSQGNEEWSDADSGIFSSTEDADSDTSEDEDPSTEWRDVHRSIRRTISELDGKVAPKLNWSAPKDATWIAAGNTMECRTPNDIYLLLKSSDFITHDLEQAFHGCADADSNVDVNIPFHLVLRKHVLMHVSLEFRCFVRGRQLLGICQRDLNHYDFLFKDDMRGRLRKAIQRFFDSKLRDTFEDENFVFDVYVPPPHNRVWLIDINPWAERTDPLLFSWLEILTHPEPTSRDDAHGEAAKEGPDAEDVSSQDSEDEEEEHVEFVPEFRVVGLNDPESYAFNSPKYSAHKMPRDVVDASRSGAGGLREFAQEWKDMLAKKNTTRNESSDDDEEE